MLTIDAFKMLTIDAFKIIFMMEDECYWRRSVIAPVKSGGGGRFPPKPVAP